ncbi:MAG: AMP-binding protein [Desulfobacteraceae bacterium]|jgi:long-chain acyl-CoA synthetase
MAEINTIPGLIKANYEKWGESEVAVRDKDFGLWQEYTWTDSYEKIKHFCLGLKSLGLEPEDKVAVIGDNEPEWYWAAFATQAGRGIVVPQFTDAIPDELKYLIDFADCKFVVARDQEQVDKILDIKDELPKMKKIIYWYYKGMRNYTEPFLLRFDQVEEMGKAYEKSHPEIFERMLEAVSPEDIANIYYTSGTTGRPKAVMCSHRALIGSARATMSLSNLSERENILCYLPPAWVGEAYLGSIPHLLSGAKLNIPEEPETVLHDITEILPYMILGGPRQWEGWVSQIRAKIAEAGAIEKTVYNIFMPIALKVADLKLKGKEVPFRLKLLYAIADLLLLRQIRDRIGLSNAKFAATAGSVLGEDTFKFIAALGIKLRQVYGSSEGGMISGHFEDDIRVGTVGPPLPGVDVKVSDDGEILVKSTYAFSKYYKNPEATAQALRDGWWYSGDAGNLDEQGHVIFMDRVSELGELRSGDKYAPQYIESGLRYSTYIKDAMAVGDRTRDYVTAIIIIDFENVGRWAEINRIPYTTFTDLSQKEEVAKLIRADVERVNGTLPEVARVKRYVSLHKEFDPDEADLTRTRKLKRESLEKRYGDLIGAMYDGRDEIEVEAEITYQDGKKGILRTSLKIHAME